MNLVQRFLRRLRYKVHLDSEYWRKLRRQALKRAQNRCEWITRTGRRCTATNRLEVHHLHYRTFGREQLEDVQVLCPRHHAIADRRRAEATQKRRKRR